MIEDFEEKKVIVKINKEKFYAELRKWFWISDEGLMVVNLRDVKELFANAQRSATLKEKKRKR